MVTDLPKSSYRQDMMFNMTDLEKALQLRGETDPRTHEIGSAIPGPGWWVPENLWCEMGSAGEAWYDEAYLEWDAPSEDKIAHAEAGLLGRFLKLEDAQPEDIIRFSQAHGLLCPFLGLDDVNVDDLMFYGDSRSGLFPLGPRSQESLSEKVASAITADRVKDWICSAALFRMLLEFRVLAANGRFAELDRRAESEHYFRDLGLVLAGRRVDRDVDEIGFADVVSNVPFFLQRGWPEDLEGQGVVHAIDAVLEAVINSMLSIGRAGFVQVKAETGFRTTFAPGSLLGALGMQLAGVLSASVPVAECFECRGLYEPERRRPRADQRNFCPPCGASGAPQRHASADYRRRKKALAGAKSDAS